MGGDKTLCKLLGGELGELAPVGSLDGDLGTLVPIGFLDGELGTLFP